MKTGSLHLFSVMFQSTPNLIFVQFELWHLFFWFPCPCESMKATKFLYVWCELSTVAKMFVLLGIWFYFGAQIGGMTNHGMLMQCTLTSLHLYGRHATEVSAWWVMAALHVSPSLRLYCTTWWLRCRCTSDAFLYQTRTQKRILATAAYAYCPDQATQGSLGTNVCTNG